MSFDCYLSHTAVSFVWLVLECSADKSIVSRSSALLSLVCLVCHVHQWPVQRDMSVRMHEHTLHTQRCHYVWRAIEGWCSNPSPFSSTTLVSAVMTPWAWQHPASGTIHRVEQVSLFLCHRKWLMANEFFQVFGVREIHQRIMSSNRWTLV